MSFLHDLFTAVAVVMLVIHISATALVPHNWMLLKSMFTMRVPIEYVKTRHPLWYERLRKLQSSKESAAAATPQSAIQPSAK